MWFWGRNKRFNFYQTPTFCFFVNIILNYISIIDNNYLYVNKFEIFYRLFFTNKKRINIETLILIRLFVMVHQEEFESPTSRFVVAPNYFFQYSMYVLKCQRKLIYALIQLNLKDFAKIYLKLFRVRKN